MSSNVSPLSLDFVFGGLKRSFRALSWPLRFFEAGVRRLKDRGHYPCESRFRLRMARYWFAASEMDRHASAHPGRPLTIVDIGCERGFTKTFSQPETENRWIGLDRDLTRPELSEAGYHRLHECDFDQPLPVESGTADVVICLHVMEHLSRPEFLAAEIERVLRPGGILIAATPVLPGPLARIRERQLRNKITRGQRCFGRHYNAFSVSRWRRMVENARLRVEAVSGAHFFRSDRNPLENFGWWIRLNQFWGALAPSLAREVFVLSRKGAAEGAPARAAAPVFGRPVMGRLAVLACMVGLLGGVFAFSSMADSHFEQLVKETHDPNDVYYFHPDALPTFNEALSHQTFSHEDPIREIVERDLAGGKDSHFIITQEYLDELTANPHSHTIGVMRNIIINGREYVLLGTEQSDHLIEKLNRKSMTGMKPFTGWDGAQVATL